MLGPAGCWSRLAEVRGVVHQALLVVLNHSQEQNSVPTGYNFVNNDLNIPTVSFGLALGWVSLASGEASGEAGGEASDEAGRGAVVAAVTTFAASLAGVPLSARALAAGRKLAIIATSGCFIVCWSLKLVASAWGGAWIVAAARVAAGLGGAAAWALAPLLAREMCWPQWRGAAVAALALAHNAGVLLMYLAADARLSQRVVLWCCLALAVLHCIVFSFMPESPSFLAAKGKIKEARKSLAWLRGLSADDPTLEREMDALPPPELQPISPFKLAKEMLSDRGRRRAFIISGIAVVGQEACGVLAILQYAERVFVLARDSQNLPSLAVNSTANMTKLGDVTGVADVMTGMSDVSGLTSPARHAVWLGGVQLVASAFALYLVERVGRRPLIVWSALGTGGALAAAAALLTSRGGAGGASGAAVALAAAVAADSAGLQPAPYSLLADMFHYQYRGCAMMLVSAAACAGNAIEVGVFPLVAASGGLVAALSLAAGLTLAYAVFAAIAVPETKGRTPEEIYEALAPKSVKDVENLKQNNDLEKCDKNIKKDQIDKARTISATESEQTVKVETDSNVTDCVDKQVSEESRCSRM